MANLILPQRFTSQPQTFVALDKSNPLCAAAAFVALPNQEVVSGLTIKRSGSTPPTLEGGVGGLGTRFTSGVAAASYLDLGVAPGASADLCLGNNGYTFFGVFTAPSVAAVAIAERNDSNAANIGWMFGINRNSQLGIEVESSTANMRAGITNAPAAGLNVLVVSGDGSLTAANVKIWLNGVQGTAGTLANGTGVRASDAAKNLYIGRNSFTSSHTHNGVIFMAGAMRRQWSDAEIYAFSRNPWQIFQAPARKWFAQGAAASGSTGTVAYTNANDTSAASGTTTILGALAKTNANDTVVASGTTTVTGTLAKTNANDTVVANGTTTVTGALATTNADDSVAASGTAGNITGTVAYTNANDTVVASGSGGNVTVSGGAPGQLLRRFSAEINGKFYYFNSIAELQQVLNSFKTKQKRKIAKKITKEAIPVTIPQVEVPVHVPMWAVKEIEKVNASLEAYYWEQYQLLLDQDEEEAIVALFG